MVSWKKVTKPKNDGGLGLQAAKQKNTALLAKLNWRFHCEKDSLWARVLSHKYITRRRCFGNRVGVRRIHGCSTVWKGLMEGEAVFKKGTKWIAGKESKLSFWFDKWLNKGTLRELIAGPLNLGEEHLQLKDVFLQGKWDWDCISFVIPPIIAQDIKAIPMPLMTNGPDRLSWFMSPSGDFVLKDAYKLACLEDETHIFGLKTGSWVWKIQSLPKIRFFLWQCCHLSLPVRDTLAARGMNISHLCPLCNGAPESIIHMLRDCPLARQVWDSLLPPFEFEYFYRLSLVDWLYKNCKSDTCSHLGIPWNIIFTFGAWSIWLQRNKVVFRDNNPPKLHRDEVTAKAAEFAFLGVNGKITRMRTTIQVRWNPPPTHWFKLNSDGSSMGNPGRAGGGGIIRNAEGKWIKGYARAIGSTTSVAAELWALRDGVQLCFDLKLPAVIIELDAMIVIELIRNARQNSCGNNNIVADCRELMSKIPRVHVQHCYREANKCADAQARRGALLACDFLFFDSPPADVALLLSLDVAGMMYERSIATDFGS